MTYKDPQHQSLQKCKLKPQNDMMTQLIKQLKKIRGEGKEEQRGGGTQTVPGVNNNAEQCELKH